MLASKYRQRWGLLETEHGLCQRRGSFIYFPKSAISGVASPISPAETESERVYGGVSYFPVLCIHRRCIKVAWSLLGKGFYYKSCHSQIHYVYGYDSPNTEIIICTNDHTIPPGLLCPFNSPIFQLWSGDQSGLSGNPIFFLLVHIICFLSELGSAARRFYGDWQQWVTESPPSTPPPAWQGQSLTALWNCRYRISSQWREALCRRSLLFIGPQETM